MSIYLRLRFNRSDGAYGESGFSANQNLQGFCFFIKAERQRKRAGPLSRTCSSDYCLKCFKALVCVGKFHPNWINSAPKCFGIDCVVILKGLFTTTTAGGLQM